LIIAVEPVFANFLRLLRNVQVNGCGSRTTLIKAAVTNESGKKCQLRAQGMEHSGVWSLVAPREGDLAEAVTVSFADVIALVNGSIDLLKIDIEGGEWALLNEANADAFCRASRIDLELHKQYSSSGAARRYFAALGFTITEYTEDDPVNGRLLLERD
jgi:FkbM family methyltransferase